MGQPITVTVGPLATASATNIGASQAGVAAKPVVLNGTTSDVVATGIAAAQAVAGAGNLTLNGSFVQAGIAQLASPATVYITSVGNDSGITFTITGTTWSAGGLVAVSEVVTGANAGVAAALKQFATVSQIAASGAAAGNVSAGFFRAATLDTPRRVILTSGGNDSAKTFTVSGTADGYTPISEVVTGANIGAASTALIYKTVTSIIPSAATAGTLTVGTNGVSTTRWVRFDDYAGNAQVAIQCTVTGTVNYTVQQTLQDPNDPTSPVADEAVVWVDSPDSAVVAATATKQSKYDTVPIWARVVLNSGTGSVSTVFRQVFTGI